MIKRIKGSALHFVVLISVLIFIILGTFLLLTYTNNLLENKASNLIENIYNAEENIVRYGEMKNFPSIRKNNIKQSYWGSFEKVISKSGEGADSFSRAALLGSEISKNFPTLYLEDHNMPLVLAGNTLIEGKVYVPGKYVRPGSVGGVYFQGPELIAGKLLESEAKLPDLDFGWLKYIDSIYNKKYAVSADIIDENFQNTFLEEKKIFSHQGGDVEFELEGNLVLFSKNPINIKKSATIDQILIIAPKIKVEAGFKGSLHAITGNFESGKDTYFEYPSSVTTFRQNENQKDTDIVLNQGTHFEGNIISLNSKTFPKKLNNIIIHDGSTVIGFIYCQGTVEFYGTLTGSLFSKNVMTAKKGSKYLNHLYNCTITNQRLSKTFGGPLLADSDKTITAWLY
ncbi:hypothetical protein ACNKXS_13830 [Christiangramia marina]|uniref:hypothetical protein n=1 Tax=Christiangramia marina TaxID=409436 RepID=UPI003AA7CD6D